jgi:cell division protein FtsB
VSVRKRAHPAIQVTRKSILAKVMFGLLLLFVAYYVLSSTIDQGEQMARILLRRSEIQGELDKAEASYKASRDLHDSMGTDAFIEKIAREKLGMLMPGEILFVD